MLKEQKLIEKKMVTSYPLQICTTAVQTVDLAAPLTGVVSIIIEKEELAINKTVIPTVYTVDKWTVFKICLVDLADEDLALGRLYLPNFGEYSFTIYNDVTVAWVDLMRFVGKEIIIS